MENQVVVLPNEVAEIAKNVSVEKRSEVQTVLNHVFNGVLKMREQLESITVKDENDEVSMKLAGTVRLAVKRERLDAEKDFDAKRAEVQQEMLGFKTLDSLYLKAKQIMQIQTKELEEIALYKEETKKRFILEQKELKTQQRMLKVAKVAPEMARSEFEYMSDEIFDMFFAGIEKAFNDKIEAEKKAETVRQEQERISNLHSNRKESVLHLWSYISDFEKTLNFGEQSESDFNNFAQRLNNAKKEDDDKKEAQRIQLEKLQKEAEDKKKRDEKRNNELRPYIVFIRDYNKMLTLGEDEYQKEFVDIKKVAQNQWELDRKEAARKDAEAEANKLALEKANKEKAKLEKEKADREAKEQAEEKRAKAEAEKAAKAPDKERLKIWVDSMLIKGLAAESMSEESIKIANDIFAKFESFKNWAKSEIEKL